MPPRLSSLIVLEPHSAEESSHQCRNLEKPFPGAFLVGSDYVSASAPLSADRPHSRPGSGCEPYRWNRHRPDRRPMHGKGWANAYHGDAPLTMTDASSGTARRNITPALVIRFHIGCPLCRLPAGTVSARCAVARSGSGSGLAPDGAHDKASQGAVLIWLQSRRPLECRHNTRS
jgi:hypothetical protein